MSNEHMDLVYRSIEEQNADKPAATRRQMIAGATATIGGLGLLGLPTSAFAGPAANNGNNTPENILNIAATAEVLATIVNTVGAREAVLDRRPPARTSRRRPARSSFTTRGSRPRPSAASR